MISMLELYLEMQLFARSLKPIVKYAPGRMEVCHFLVDKRLVVVDVSPWADADALQPPLQGQDVFFKEFSFQKEVEDTFMDSPSLTKNCPSLTASPFKGTVKATISSISPL